MRWFSALFFAGAAAAAAFEGTVLVDFGRNDYAAPSPDSSGRVWNQIATDSAAVPAGGIANALTESGSATGIAVSVAGFGAGANINGTTVPDAGALGPLAVPEATRDSFFISPGTTATVVLTGMAPAGLYRITLFGSRDATETRVTRFTAQGTGTVTGTVQTSGAGIGLAPQPDANRSFVAVLEDVRPTAGGQVTLSGTVVSGGFGYLGAWSLVRTGTVSSNAAPSATGVAWEGAPRVGGTLQGRYVYEDPEGDAESGTVIRWERSGTPSGTGTTVAGATTTAYVTGAADAGNYLRMVVTPGAAAGATPGAEVASGWRGPVAGSGASSVFHVGNSFTRWGDVPAQVAAFAAARGRAHARGDQIRDGEGLGYHWANGLAGGTLTRGTPSRLELATETWDTLVLQPMSREWLPANLGAFTSNADLFDNLCDARGTRMVLYAYWPYLSEAVDTQDAINAAFESVRTSLSSDGPPVLVIPAGEAFRDVAREIEAGTLTGITRADLYQDDLHPSDLGYYLSSLVHFAVLFRENPAGLPATGISADPNSGAPVSIPAGLAGEFQRIAWKVARFHPGTGVTRGRFDAWAEANAPAGQREPGDAPLGDGVSNLARWAFGAGASDFGGGGRLPVAGGGPGFSATYRVGADAEDAGVRIVHEWSADLVSWDHPEPAGLVVTRSGDTVTLAAPVSEQRLFFRAVARMDVP